MLQQRRGRADISEKTGGFTCNVGFVGKTNTFVPHGFGCTRTHVQNVWDNCAKEDQLPRCRISVTRHGIRLENLEKHAPAVRGDVITTPGAILNFEVQDVSYFCAEGSPHQRVFSWIHRNKMEGKLECYVVLCSSKEKAKLLAANVSLAFSHAFHDYKIEKVRRHKRAIVLRAAEQTHQFL